MRYGFGVPFQGSEMTVIDTDYKEYAVLYSCTSSIIPSLYHTEYVWLMSRDGTLSNPTRQNIYEILDKLKINRVGLQVSERHTCPGNNTLVTRESEQNLGEVVAAPGTDVAVDSVPAVAIKQTEPTKPIATSS